MLWAVGGIVAVCGAMAYAELGAALPRSGGEYNFLARIYHPAAGFISGWVSVTIGFAAPTALAAITFAAYTTSALPGESSDALQKALACSLVVALTLVHASTRRNSGGLQVVFTILKVGVIVIFCLAAVTFAKVPQPVNFWPAAGDSVLLTSSAFAVSLIYVSYAYTGWNAATVLGVFVLRWRQPNLPRPYRTFAYPLTPLIYLALTGWTLTFVLINKPVEGLFGLGIIGAGLIFYLLSAARNRGYRATA